MFGAAGLSVASLLTAVICSAASGLARALLSSKLAVTTPDVATVTLSGIHDIATLLFLVVDS